MKLFPWMAFPIFFMTACSSAEWVHPNKPKGDFTLDYNQCQGEAMRDPKNQQGNNYFVLQATERCVGKRGWVLREKND